MIEKRNPGVGAVIVIVTGVLFWGSVAGCTGYFIRAHQEAVAIRGACEELVAYGWDIPVDECVRELRP